MRRWLTFAFSIAIAAGAMPSPMASAPVPSAIATMRSEPALAQYRAFRKMHASNEKMSHEGWLEAWTEFDSGGFRYQIVSERGSDTVRNRVLKALLKREQELIANGDFGRGELTDENYTFGAETASPDGVLRYIEIRPKRKDVMLIDGRMVLNRDGDLLRVEGLLAKNPSFWTTQVNVTRHYTRVDGVRVPVSTESLAKVRFAGLSRLNVSYQYETINHRLVRTAAGLAPAASSPASAR